MASACRPWPSGDDVVAVAWTNRANGEHQGPHQPRRRPNLQGARARSVRRRCRSTARTTLTDGLVGIAANDRSLHVAWSDAGRRQCYRRRHQGPHLARSRRQLEPGPHHHRARLVRLARARRARQDRHRHGPGHRRRPRRVPLGEERAQLAREDASSRRRATSSARPMSPSCPARRRSSPTSRSASRTASSSRPRLVSRRSPDDGASWNQPKPVTQEAKLLRMAPNLVNSRAASPSWCSRASSTASRATSSLTPALGLRYGRAHACT